MIIITEDTIPVACYDDVSLEEALKAYISEFLALSNIHDILMDEEGTAFFDWKGKRYDASAYLEYF